MPIALVRSVSFSPQNTGSLPNVMPWVEKGTNPSSKIVNGASLKPRSGGKPKKIVLLLHGFGLSRTDMILLAPQWQDLLPDTLFLASHAPERCRMMGAGCQ